MPDSSKQYSCPLCGTELNTSALNTTMMHTYNSVTGKCENVQVERNDWQMLAGNRAFAEKISDDINLN